nr:hypothetical protein [uncultured Sphingosinicella sp.]
MAENKDQLVDEQTMEKMSVAPPDPETEANSGSDAAGSGKPADQQRETDTIPQDASDAESGVADQDPLSAHPS